MTVNHHARWRIVIASEVKQSLLCGDRPERDRICANEHLDCRAVAIPELTPHKKKLAGRALTC